MEQFFDEVDVGENHPSTAVPLELELVKGLALGNVFGEELKVGIPFVTDDFSALESMTEMVWRSTEKSSTSPIETMNNFMRDGNFLHPPGLPHVASPS